MALYSRVFVYYPRGVETGGPEALHQLVDSLRRLRVEAFLVPIPGSENRPRSPRYEGYDAPERHAVEDEDTNAVIVPETLPGLLRRTRKAQSFCWWLSIDNSPMFMHARARANGLPTATGRLRVLRRLKRKSFGLLTPFLWNYYGLARAQHLAQSQYAWSFLHSRFNVCASALSDFTVATTAHSEKPPLGMPVIAYNAAKGGQIVEEVIATKRVRADWVPIRDMTPSEVQDTLARAHVYLDLGHHPGKDRLPREAAANGCLVVAARRGSAANSVDLPIPCEHKIPDEQDKTPAQTASRVISDLLASLPRELAKQEDYRAIVTGERERFSQEVEAIFTLGAMGCDHASFRGREPFVR